MKTTFLISFPVNGLNNSIVNDQTDYGYVRKTFAFSI